MGDIRKANIFIECGFNILKQLHEPQRPIPEEIPYPPAYYLDTLYYGSWDREDFGGTFDEEYSLSEFEPDFRLYYAIACLRYVCKGHLAMDACHLGDYFREVALYDAAVTNNQTAVTGISCVLNGMRLVEIDMLNSDQKWFMKELEYESDSTYNFLTKRPDNGPFKFDFGRSLFDLPSYLERKATTASIYKAARRFVTSPSPVHDAFFNPKKACRWLFATENSITSLCEIEARIGGRYTITTRTGDNYLRHTGEFLEIDQPTRIVFTLEIPQHTREIDKVEIDILSSESGCELALTHVSGNEFDGEEPRIAIEWDRMLFELEKLLDEQNQKP